MFSTLTDSCSFALPWMWKEEMETVENLSQDWWTLCNREWEAYIFRIFLEHMMRLIRHTFKLSEMSPCDIDLNLGYSWQIPDNITMRLSLHIYLSLRELYKFWCSDFLNSSKVDDFSSIWSNTWGAQRITLHN